MVLPDCASFAESRGMKKPSLRQNIYKFNENNNHDNDLKDEEYGRRRKNRRDGDKRIRSHRKIRLFRRMYIPATIFIAGGIVATLASSVWTIGRGTCFWEYKEEFRIAGPIVLVSGLVILLIAVGLINEEYLRMKPVEKENPAEIGIKEFPEKCKCNCSESVLRSMEFHCLYHGNVLNCDGNSLRPLLSMGSSQSSSCTVSEVQRLNKVERTNQLPSIHIQKERSHRIKLDSEGSSECDSSLPSASTEITSLCSPSRPLYFDFTGKKNASRQSSLESRQHNETSLANNQANTSMTINHDNNTKMES